MKTRIKVLIVCLLFGDLVFAQNITPERLGFEQFTQSSKELGMFNYYLSIDSTNIRKPLLVYLDGFRRFSTFPKVRDGYGFNYCN